ncbi:chitin deacetylase 1-like isoform X1 [Planococcus citri]|uniref:chitin deacetylase 1-like isoform X1 n=1 Tax=Planococcus citri TaxID=170843 RepID=UPI0031F76E44
MVRVTSLVLFIALFGAIWCVSVREKRQNQNGEDAPDDPSIDDLCKNRPPDEYFRLTIEGDCRDVVRCDQAGENGVVRLAGVRCPNGLAFDIDRQTCDWKTRVKNCDKLEKPRKIMPILKTDEPICAEKHLACGNRECIAKELFCNDKPDCQDESDENACTVELDPNRAPDCDPSECTLPDCFCSADGTRIPGNIEPIQVPQMITITFNGAVNVDNMDLYEEIFNGARMNPNGCQIKGTFFVNHKYTNYAYVQELHRKGHEIAVFSLTHKDDPRYWTGGSYDDWLAEMAGARVIIERFANITSADSPIQGIRAPYLRVGGNKQFEMMVDQYFTYDASITAPLGRVPIWPYTLFYRMPHKCNGNAQNCPSRSHAVWEMVMNELDRRDDPTFDESLPGCHMVDSCSNIQTGEQFGRLLRHNFDRHYSTNRAPLGLHFHASWLKSKKEFKDELIKFIEDMLKKNDVYFVNYYQVIQWIQNPVELNTIREFALWKVDCDVKGQPFCSLPNPCPLTTRELPGETIRLFTCMECPNNYPWILDPTGDGFSGKDRDSK